MTLILVAANSEFAVQLSDRRLSKRGTTVDDEANKAVLVHARDGRLLVGFTGLARYRTFRTEEFMVDVALAAAPPDYTVHGIASRFASAATSIMNTHAVVAKLPASQRHLTMSLVGFRPDPRFSQPTLLSMLVTNGYGDKPGPARDALIATRVKRPKEGVDLETVTFIDAIGATTMVTEEAVAPLRRLLRDGAPAKAVVGKGVDLIRSWTPAKASSGLIGDQVSSIVIPADQSLGWSTDYHSSVPSKVRYWPMEVLATGREANFAYKLEVAQTEGVFVVPKVGRNHPCPCGSGIKYKRCHGSRPTASEGQLH